VEADAYWCLTKLLDNIQDHYTFSQPGLQRMILRLEDLVQRVDRPLHEHFLAEGIQYMQFSFRWMNCALLRELPLRAIIRLWDTYFAEEQGGFERFHVYVCAVLLTTFSEQLLGMQFQEALMFLQDLPTSEWGEEEMGDLLARAFILSTRYDDSTSHFDH
jgi:TBC1 domain family member 2